MVDEQSKIDEVEFQVRLPAKRNLTTLLFGKQAVLLPGDEGRAREAARKFLSAQEAESQKEGVTTPGGENSPLGSPNSLIYAQPYIKPAVAVANTSVSTGNDDTAERFKWEDLHPTSLWMPRKLWRRFKAICAERGFSGKLNWVISNIVAQYINSKVLSPDLTQPLVSGGPAKRFLVEIERAEIEELCEEIEEMNARLVELSNRDHHPIDWRPEPGSVRHDRIARLRQAVKKAKYPTPALEERIKKLLNMK